MKKKLTKFIYSFFNVMLVLNILLIVFSTTFASQVVSEQGQDDKLMYASDVWWNSAATWFNKDSNAIFNSNPTTSTIISEFQTMLNVIGSTVIVLVTIILGIKYMFGSVEGKADVKENLITLLVACVFFFGWNSIWALFTPTNSGVRGFAFIMKDDDSWRQVVGRIYSIAVYALNILSIAAIIFVGIKYIFSGVAGKTELKAKSGQFIIGLILSFATISLLNFISTIVNSTLEL
ncbi:MAG: hypothetical protein RSB76_03600 [Clostridia bacterium]